MISRREPLLWLQLMAIGVIPLELELMRLVLAGPAYGPAPALERLLIWGLAVVAPGGLLWRRPPDWASLLLVRIAPARRNVDQRRISAIQQPLSLKAALIIGIALLLPLFWSIDHSALLVAEFSPTQNSSRLTALLIAAPLLALMLWQWQQIVQSIWLLSRSDETFADLTPINATDLQTNHLSLGVGLLQLPPLQWEAGDDNPQKPKTNPSGDDLAQISRSAAEPAPDPKPGTAVPEITANAQNDEPEPVLENVEIPSTDNEDPDQTRASADREAAQPEQSLDEPQNPEHKLLFSEETAVIGNDAENDAETGQASARDNELDSQPEPKESAAAVKPAQEILRQTDLSPVLVDSDDDDAASVTATVAIKPQQSPEEHHGPDLDGQVSADSAAAGTDAEAHHEESEATGSEQGGPEQPSQPPPGGA